MTTKKSSSASAHGKTPAAIEGRAGTAFGASTCTATHAAPNTYKGVPCKLGHDGLRFKANNECVLCRRAKFKRYLDKNRDARNARRRALVAAKYQAVGKTVRLRRVLTDEQRREVKRINRLNRDIRKKTQRQGRLGYGIRKKLFFLQKGKCAICRCRLKATGLQKFHLDHIEPLALGGPHTDANVQLLCPTCNVNKGAKPPVEYMQSLGRLL